MKCNTNTQPGLSKEDYSSSAGLVERHMMVGQQLQQYYDRTCLRARVLPSLFARGISGFRGLVCIPSFSAGK